MESKPQVVLITTSTLHHKFFIKILNKIKKIELVIFLINSKKEIDKSEFKKKEEIYERKFFFNNKKNFNIKNQKFLFKNINSKALQNKVIKLRPSMGILFGTKKVDKEVINVFNGKLINIHRGIMEKYRGLDSEFWAAFYEDFKNIGTTIHYVNTHLDKGKIIFQKRLKLTKRMKSYQLRALTTKIATQEIKDIVLRIVNKKVSIFKNQKIGKYFSMINKKQKKIALKNFDNFCERLSR